MNFFRKHLAPTLHNAIGTIIGAGLLALVAFIKPLRDEVERLAVLAIPLWVVLILTGALAILEFILLKRRRRKRLALLARLQRERAQEQELQRISTASLRDQLAQITFERDEAIKQKEGFMFRLQELSKRIGTVVSTRPASGVERTRNPTGKQ